jgi:hypothetical protein
MAGSARNRMPGSQGKAGVPSRWGIHIPEDRSKQDTPKTLGIHSPAVDNPDIRSRGIRRAGSRNRCPVAVEAHAIGDNIGSSGPSLGPEHP